MSENAEKSPQKQVRNWKKPSWNGVLRLQVVDILMSGDGFTLTEIQVQLEQRNSIVTRGALYKVIEEIKSTFKNLQLHETKVCRSSNTAVPAFFLKRNKKK